jgi:hypothetical protein
MSTAFTVEEVWKLFAETDRKFQETALRFQETDRKFQETDRKFQELERVMKVGSQETDRKFQETDRKFQETDRKFQETDRKFQELERVMKAGSQETDRRFQELERVMKAGSQETDRRFQELERVMKAGSQETDRKFQEGSERFLRELKESQKAFDAQMAQLNKQLGQHGNRLGEFVQEMVRPAVVRLFQEWGLPVHQVMANVAAYDDNKQFIMEIDLVVINNEVLVAVECKSHLSNDDVNEHLERLALFKRCFSQYNGYRILGAVAGMVVPTEVGRRAYKQGLFVLAQSGDAVEIRNGEGFKPKEW